MGKIKAAGAALLLILCGMLLWSAVPTAADVRGEIEAWKHSWR